MGLRCLAGEVRWVSKGKINYPSKAIGIKLTAEDYAWVKARARAEDKPLGVLVREILVERIHRNDTAGDG